MLSASEFHKIFTPALPMAQALLPLLPLTHRASVARPGRTRAIFLDVSSSRKLQGWWQKFRLRSKKRKVGASEAVGQAPWEADYELLPCEGLFDEYLEMGRSHVSGHGHGLGRHQGLGGGGGAAIPREGLQPVFLWVHLP